MRVYDVVVIRVTYCCMGKSVTEEYTFYNCTQAQAYTDCMDKIEQICGDSVSLKMRLVEMR